MNINGVDTSSVNLEQSTNKEQCSLKNNTEKEENTKITFRNAGYVSALNIMQEKIEKNIGELQQQIEVCVKQILN